MADLREGSDSAGQPACWKNRQEAEPNEGWSLEAACTEIRISRADQVVKPGHLLPQLGANATDKKIAVRWHRTQNDGRPILDRSCCLRQRRQDNITLFHGLMSARV